MLYCADFLMDRDEDALESFWDNFGVVFGWNKAAMYEPYCDLTDFAANVKDGEFLYFDEVDEQIDTLDRAKKFMAVVKKCPGSWMLGLTATGDVAEDETFSPLKMLL
jgi:hypothetical protein